MRLNREFLSQVKYLKHNHILILMYLYQWVGSNNPPEFRRFSDGVYFWVVINKLADDLHLSRRQVQNALYRLENKDKKISTSLQPFIYVRQVHQENKMYLSLNTKMMDFLFLPCTKKNQEFFTVIHKRLPGNTYKTPKINNKEKSMLLDESDFNTEHKTWNIYAEKIVNRILTKYANVFSTRIPKGKLTKTYINCCKAVQDIYNGNFVNSRIYPLSEKFLNNKQFDIDDWKETIKSVKGDWNKVKQLIFKAIDNYQLMFDEKRMPFKKDNLTTSLSDWFYNSYNGGTHEPTSYFVYSLKEPNITSKQLSENKADKIYDTLSSNAKAGGNNFVGLNNKMPSGAFWEKIKNIVSWADTLLQFDDNAKYWISSGDKIISKFYDFIKERNISISLNTFDIEKATQCNGPWCWFINEAIGKHSLNSSIVSCVTEDDFYDCYNSTSTNKNYWEHDVDIVF